MCYICNSFHGHEAGCPFASEEKTKYYVCIECGEEVPEHEAHEKDGETCLCDMCYFGWRDEQ